MQGSDTMQKEIIVIENNETIQSNLQDFITYNFDGLTFEEVNNLNRLKVNDSMKAKLEKLPIQKLVSVVWKVFK